MLQVNIKEKKHMQRMKMMLKWWTKLTENKRVKEINKLSKKRRP